MTLFSPCTTVHATRRLPDSVTAQSPFRRMNKTSRHLFSWRLLLPKQDKETRERRGFPPSAGPSAHSVKSQLFTAYLSSRPTPGGALLTGPLRIDGPAWSAFMFRVDNVKMETKELDLKYLPECLLMPSFKVVPIYGASFLFFLTRGFGRSS